MYNPNIPVASDPLLISQAQIRANFTAIANVFAANHIPLTQNDDFKGMHTFLRMIAQSDPVTDATHVGFYNKIMSLVPELFFAPNNAQTPIQLTYPSISTLGDPQTAGLATIAISNITTGATTTITTASNHGFNSGQSVTFAAIKGTVELNGQTAVATVTGATTFTIPIATANAYISGGTVAGWLQYSFVAGPFVFYAGKITKPTNNQTIILSPTTTLKYVGLTSANVDLNISPTVTNVHSVPTNITGSQFNVTFTNVLTGKLDIYYIAIGQ